VDLNSTQAAIVPQGYAAPDFPAGEIVAQRIEARGFTTEDILWALGIWTVIFTLSPVIVFYMLMVA
jgi:hypothetical protein